MLSISLRWKSCATVQLHPSSKWSLMGSVKQKWRCSSHTPSSFQSPTSVQPLKCTPFRQSHGYVRILSRILGSILVNMALKWSSKDVHFPLNTFIKGEKGSNLKNYMGANCSEFPQICLLDGSFCCKRISHCFLQLKYSFI